MWLDLKRKEVRQVLYEKLYEELYEKQDFPAYVFETLNQRTLYAGCR